VLTELERHTFETRGYVVLERAVDADAAESMHEGIWALLDERGVRRTDRATWPQGPVSNLRAIRRGDDRPAASAPLAAVLDGLFGTGEWKPPKHWGQAMVTFPEPGPWAPPRDQWHVDHPFWFPPDEVYGVNVFLFVDEVEEHGGGTLALEGSPMLVRRFVTGLSDPTARPKTLTRGFRAEHQWLATTPIEELMVEGVDVDGTRARVVELTGAPGDAVVCHPWLMHSASPNVTRRPRMMRTSRIYRRDPS
jgi:ectoine hydroxylase-related dioxygenase (phytanoyl-CoA dioxygenase family)